MADDDGAAPSAFLGLNVVDLGRGLPAGVFAKFFADAGASVIRVRPPAGDPFESLNDAYGCWYCDIPSAAETELPDLLAGADVCFIGGEDHPDMKWEFAADELSARFPRLIVVELTGLEGQGSDVPATEMLVQAAMGLTAEHLSDRHVYAPFAPGLYGGAVLALIGAFVALIDRLSTGSGQVVRTSMEQGIALLWTQMWMQPEVPNAAFDVVAPLDLQHMIFRCAGGKYVEFTFGTPGSVRRVYAVLGLETDVDEQEPGGPRVDRGAKNYFGMYDEMAQAVEERDLDELLSALRAAGIPAEPVLYPGECWSEGQAVASGSIRKDASGTNWVGATVHHADGRRVAGGQTSLPKGDRPLSGLRILDFGTLIAGPYASTILAKLGAEVVKVEPAPARPGGATIRNLLAGNLGKRNMCLNMKSPAGQDVLRRLVERADVVHYNYRVGVAERIGLDAPSLRRVNPRIVSLSTTAFGSEGPKAFDSGMDMVVAALTGHQRRAGAAVPTWYRAPVIDFFCGALGALGILMAVYAGLDDGVPLAVETSLYGAGLFLLQDVVVRADGRISDGAKLDRSMAGLSAFERLYEVADGWIAVDARSAAASRAFLLAAGLPGNPENLDVDDSETQQLLVDHLRSMKSDDALSRLSNHGVWAVAACDDPWGRLRARAAEIPSVVSSIVDDRYGTVIGCFGDLVSLSRWPAGSPGGPGLAPRGRDTRSVLTEAGFAPSEIAELYDTGIVA